METIKSRIRLKKEEQNTPMGIATRHYEIAKHLQAIQDLLCTPGNVEAMAFAIKSAKDEIPCALGLFGTPQAIAECLEQIIFKFDEMIEFNAAESTKEA